MSDASEAPSNASVSDNKAKKRSKKKSKYNAFQSVITEIKEALTQICGRLDRLERPIAHPKTTKIIPTPDPGPMSALGPPPAPPAPSRPPGPMSEPSINGAMPNHYNG